MPFLCDPSDPSARQLGVRRVRRVTSFWVKPLYIRAREEGHALRLINLNVDVALLDVLAVVEHSVGLGLNLDILQTDAVDGHLGKSVELHGTTSTIADDVADVDVTEDGGLLGNRLFGSVVGIIAVGQHLGDRLASIVHVEGDGISLDIGHRHVVDEDVLDDTATTTGGLEAQADISTQELAAGDKDVAYATTHLGANHEAAMTSKDRAAIDHHILTGARAQTAVLVLTTLDTDAIVAGIELGIDDEGVLTRLQVEGIAILCVGWIARQDIVDDDILTHQWMDIPCG